jgi:hypothetical protein
MAWYQRQPGTTAIIRRSADPGKSTPPRTGSRPAAEYADQRGQSKETRGNSGPLGISTGSAHKETSLHSAQAPLKTQPQGLLPRRNRASRRPPDERYLRTRSPAQARPRPSHRRPGDRAAQRAARSDSPERSRRDRGLRSTCDGQDSPLSGYVDTLLLCRPGGHLRKAPALGSGRDGGEV